MDSYYFNTKGYDETNYYFTIISNVTESFGERMDYKVTNR